MPTAPNSSIVAGFEALLVAGVLMAFGFLLATSLFGRSVNDSCNGWALALAALTLWVLLLMLAHIATGGAILSNAGFVRLLTAVVGVALTVRSIRRRVKDPPWIRVTRAETIAAVAVVLLGLATWCLPIWRTIPIPIEADTPLHMGWATQLMNGEPVPSSGYSGKVPNYYTWLFHGLVAFVAAFTPGGRAYHALAPVQVLAVIGMVLGLFGLGRAVVGGWVGGAACALFGALAGGFGFLLARGPDLAYHRGADGNAPLAYMGDMLIKWSYNSSWHNLSPPLPRDLTYALLPAFLLLLLLGLRGRRTLVLLGAGALLGAIGLIAAETFYLGLGAALLVALLTRVTGREIATWRVALFLLTPAVSLYAVWVVPLFLNRHQLGFRDLSVAPVILPPAAVLVSWGIATPFAIVGGLTCVRQRAASQAVRVCVAVPVVSVGMLVAAPYLPNVLGEGVTVLSFSHRYWMLVYLSLSLLAAFGASRVFRLLTATHRGAAAIAVAGVVIVAIASPVLGNLSLPGKTLRYAPGSKVIASLQGGRSVHSILASTPGRRCTLAVPIPLSTDTFSFTGYRHVVYTRDPHHLWPFMRWRTIWSRIGPLRMRVSANRRLTEGTVSPTRFRRTAAWFGVDAVVTPVSRLGAPSFEGYETEVEGRSSRPRYGVVWVGRCND